MPLPTGSSLNVVLTIVAQSLKVRLPGGIELKAIPLPSVPNALDVSKQLLGQANTALAPLSPIFNIIGALKALFEFAKAVPSLNPVTIGSKLVDVAKSVDQLAALIPQLSVPLLVLDTIDALIAILNGIVTELNALLAQEAKISSTQSLATSLGNTDLQAIVDGATAQVSAQLSSLSNGLEPINQMITLLNLVGSLIPGFPTIPSLSSLGSSVSGAVTLLQNSVTTLQNVRALIPVP